MKRMRARGVLWVVSGVALLASGVALSDTNLNHRTLEAAAPTIQGVPLVLLHTNDLHSHFRPDQSLQALGGIGRIKTAVDAIRSKNPNTLLVDGGDWSEGHVYYADGAGRETLRMMDALSYDVAVVGNHDWLNGPVVLMDAVQQANPRMTLISANLDLGAFKDAALFRKLIPPYTIKNVEGAKVAFIGLSTYELIYDSYLSPVKVSAPFEAVRSIIRSLKGQADAFVAVSHNSIRMNQALLQSVPELDLVVGAHDHVKLTRPVRVARSGAPEGWVVETGSWGRYLGEVKMTLYPGGNRRPDISAYRLIQMDRRFPENAEILTKIADSEGRIARKIGPIFERELGKSDVHLGRQGLESRMGNFAVDAYRAATGADISLDVINFIYGEIFPGSVKEVDVLNANPGIYNPKTGRAWELHTVSMKGRTIKWVLGLLFSSKRLSQLGLLTISGLEVVFDPVLAATRNAMTLVDATGQLFQLYEPEARDPDTQRVIRSVQMGGRDLDDDRAYTVAINGGMVETFRFVNELIPPGAGRPKLIPMDGLKNTGSEAWREMANYMTLKQRLTTQNVPIGGRVTSQSANLGVISDEIEVQTVRDSATTVFAVIRAPIRNFGATRSEQVQARLWVNKNGNDYAIDPDLQEMGGALDVSPLDPGRTQILTWKVSLPIQDGSSHFWVKLEGVESESDPVNNSAIRWFVAPPQAPASSAGVRVLGHSSGEEARAILSLKNDLSRGGD